MDRGLLDGLPPLKGAHRTGILQSEADAFRLVILAVGYFALIVVAAAINRWLGVAVFVILTGATTVQMRLRARREPPMRITSSRRSAPGERRDPALIANETVGRTLREEIRRRAEDFGAERVRVICPTLSPRAVRYASDEDAARA